MKNGEYCYVLSSPQTGKSSLKVNTTQLLQAENIICIALDMSRVNNKTFTLDEWYDQVILALEKSFTFPRYFPELWWEEMANMPGDEKLFVFTALTAPDSQKVKMMRIAGNWSCLIDPD